VRSLPESFRIPILASHLQTVLLKVLWHALGAVPEGAGRITVAARLNARECLNPGLRRTSRKTLRITLEHNGFGNLPTLRRTNTMSEEPGLGLGQARKLLDLYGGTLRFERLAGSGTRMHIVWPF